MTKRILLAAFCIFLTITVNSQNIGDAFKGILPVTDPSMKISLNGTWALKVVEGITDDISVPAEDPSWGSIPVPGCWETYGFWHTNYAKTQPISGYYRTSFRVPARWKGQRIVLRFDGVLYGYDLWVNGHYAGTWHSGYNTALFDVTPFLNEGSVDQELAMRVISQHESYGFDINDDWSPCGIIRDVSMMAVPETHLSDLTIHADLSGEVKVDARIAGADKDTRVINEILDADGKVVGKSRVSDPKPWTAETPYLYTLRTRLMRKNKVLQTFEHKFGFRELTIDGKVIKLNGQPIKFRGVANHATDPFTMKVISDSLLLKDMTLMKEAGVNCIRTSHYPREPRFYELADSLGFYIIDEVPFGYGEEHLNDPDYYEILRYRAEATIMRDKNHPCVLIWSVGNENDLTDICIEVGKYVKSIDSTRPICYPQIGGYFTGLNYDLPSFIDIYAPHYPRISDLLDFYRRSDRPVIFTEYCHSLGNSFEDHDIMWEIIERTPWLAGGCVWEWVDQGAPFKDAGKKANGFYGFEYKIYTSETGGFDLSEDDLMDGMLYPNRIPLPNYYELRHNYAQAAVTDSILTAGSPLHIRNRYDFINLKGNVTFDWTLTEDRDTVARGSFSPDCPPRSTVEWEPGELYSPGKGGIRILNLEVSDAHGRIINRQSVPVMPSDPTSRIIARLDRDSGDPIDAMQEGPLVRVGRKATLTEIKILKGRRFERYLLRLSPDGSRAGQIKTSIKTGKAGNATRVSFSLTPAKMEMALTEFGVAFLLNPAIDRVQWIGNGVMPTYPGRYRAGRYGFWALHKDDLYFEGNRRGVDAALLTDRDGNGVLMLCRSGDVSFEQTDKGIVLTYNAAVSGMGPKFNRSSHTVMADAIGTVSGEFYLYKVEAGSAPRILKDLFFSPDGVPAPFHPFLTQYDTYLMRFDDIVL